MNPNNYFDAARLWLLLKMELFRIRKGIVMTLVIAFGVMFVISVLVNVFSGNNEVYDHTENHSFNLIMGGFIFSSLAFPDLGRALKRYQYLTLPASTFEKFISMWLLTSVGWVIFYTIIFKLYTLAANPVMYLIFSRVTFHPFDMFGASVMDTIKYYFVLNGIFLVGAAHFRGYVFPKTLVTLVLFFMVCGTIVYFVMKDVFLTDHMCNDLECDLLTEFCTHKVWAIMRWLLWWILAPLCWIITYFGLKEKEV